MGLKFKRYFVVNTLNNLLKLINLNLDLNNVIGNRNMNFGRPTMSQKPQRQIAISISEIKKGRT